MDSAPRYKRILLKLSGEALLGDDGDTLSPVIVGRIADELCELAQAGVQVGVVIGGGNIFRGANLASAGVDRVTADHMGMLATVINALAMQDALEARGAKARVMSAIKINQICEDYIRRRAVRHLEKGRITIFAAGTGNPFFTTDSAASLRAIEIGADLLLKGTKVDGVYTADPMKDPKAERYASLTYEEVLRRNLAVMDATAIVLCRGGHASHTGRQRMISDVKTQADAKMRKSIASRKDELTKIRTGRAHTSLLDHITVEYFGSQVPLSQVANVAVVDSRTLSVTPWEKPMVQVVEKAIMTSDLGLNPATSGNLIRIPLPPLTEERRRDLIKVVRSEAEGAKVAIRNIRRDANNDL